uniref:MMS19 nucleotide excision repair protein n=1 Tax=Anopheles minimus TaxID=112268 RepID=A0A182VS07_9DIPT
MAWSQKQFIFALTMVVTGSINTLSTKWADNIESEGSDGQVRRFEHPFVQACAMFLGEFLCLLTFKGIYYHLRRKNNGAEDRHDLVQGNREFSPFILFVPAMCDMLATSLMYVGLNLTYPSSFQLLRGSVIIFVAILSVAFLNRTLVKREWFGIAFIMLGLVVVGMSDVLSKDNTSSQYTRNNVITGDLLIILAQIITAVQMVYEEYYVTALNIPALQAVGWEGKLNSLSKHPRFFGFSVLGTLLLPMYFIHVMYPFNSNAHGVLEDLPDALAQLANNYQLIIAICGMIVSIAFFNFAGISVTKEISATTRMVLDSVRTLVVWMVSLLLVWQKFHYLQLIGFAGLLFGMCLYNDIFVLQTYRRVRVALLLRIGRQSADRMSEVIINRQADEPDHIIAGKLNIAEFVEELGPALTHTDPSIRAKGTTLLSNVLTDLPADCLNASQVELLCTFYIDRSLDHNTVTPMVLAGIEALTHMTHFPDGAAVRLLRALFERVPCQSQKKPERTLYIRTVLTLADRKTAELKAWGVDFVYGVIGTIEGERDPRNLLYLFEHMPAFIRTFPLFHLAEEMFETFACYFPIDFHPNPSDPAAITREALAELLANCLCATAEMAEFAVELLLEKLDSSLIVAKLDSLALLGRCLEMLDAAKIEEHYDELWIALKKELFPAGTTSAARKELDEAAYATVQALAKNATGSESIAKALLDKLLLGVMGGLTDASSKQFESCLRVELSCAQASEYCAVYVIEKLIPILLAQLHSDEHIEARVGNVLVDAIQRLCAVCAHWYCVEKLDTIVVGQMRKKLIEILLQEADTSEQKRSALMALAAVPEMVTSENRYVVYSTIVKILLNASDKSKPTIDAVQDCLFSFAIRYQQEVKTIVLEKLITHDFVTVDPPVVQLVFKTLGKFILYHGYLDKMVKFFLAKIFDPEIDNSLSILAMDTLTDVVESGNSSQLGKAELFVQYKLIDRFFEYASNDQLSSEYLHAMAHLIGAVVKQLSVEDQHELILARLPSLKLQQRADLYLASGLLGYLDQSVPLVDHFENLVTDLSKLALESEDGKVRDICNRLLCSLFNRMPDDEHHRGVLKRLLKTIREELKKHNHQAVIILGWIGKGLIARGHAEAGEIIDDVAELLDHPTLGHIAALAFEILSVEFPQLHLPLLRNLFKQKLFVWVMKKLEHAVEKYAATHLKALAFVLAATPHAVLKMNLSKVGPVLLRCLAQDDDRTVQEALTIVLRFTRDLDPFVQDHLQTRARVTVPSVWWIANETMQESQRQTFVADAFSHHAVRVRKSSHSNASSKQAVCIFRGEESSTHMGTKWSTFTETISCCTPGGIAPGGICSETFQIGSAKLPPAVSNMPRRVIGCLGAGSPSESSLANGVLVAFGGPIGRLICEPVATDVYCVSIDVRLAYTGAVDSLPAGTGRLCVGGGGGGGITGGAVRFKKLDMCVARTLFGVPKAGGTSTGEDVATGPPPAIVLSKVESTVSVRSSLLSCSSSSSTSSSSSAAKGAARL